MGPSPAARRFDARLRFYIAARRVVTTVDGSDILTLACLALLGYGVVSLAGTGAAAIVLGSLLAFMTPIGTAIRVFVRGK